MATLAKRADLSETPPTELETNPHRDRVRLMNISHATDLWLGELERQQHSERTVDTYRRLLDKLAEGHARHVDVDDISSTHVRKFLDSQSRKRDGSRKSASTIAQNVSILSGFFDFLTREGVVRHNPTRRNGDRIISRPPQVAPDENDNITSISGEDVRRLLAAAVSWPERLAISVALYLGPRRAALAQARLEDYDPEERTLAFDEKGNKRIRKPVPDKLAELIEGAIAAGLYASPSDYLIPSASVQRRPGERDARVISRLIEQVAARAGVTTHVHALRAAFAVHYLEENPGRIVALQKLMGHRRPETTHVYLRRLNRHNEMETVRALSWDEAEVEA